MNSSNLPSNGPPGPPNGFHPPGPPNGSPNGSPMNSPMNSPIQIKTTNSIVRNVALQKRNEVVISSKNTRSLDPLIQMNHINTLTIHLASNLN